MKKSLKIVTCIVAAAILITAGIVGYVLWKKSTDQTIGNPESSVTMDTGTVDGENSANVTDSTNTQISPAETSGDNGGISAPEVLIDQDDADQNDNNTSGNTTGNQNSDSAQQPATTSTPSNNDNGSNSGNRDNSDEGSSGGSNQTDSGSNDDQSGSDNSQGVGLPEIPIN